MIWFILFIFMTISLTALICKGGYCDAADYALTGVVVAIFTMFCLTILGLVVEEGILPSIVDDFIVEEYREELYCVSGDEVYVIKNDDGKYSYITYEETKGYINKDLCSSEVYFIEIEPGDTPHLSAYVRDWGNNKLNLLFTNSRSHYTFYVPSIPKDFYF